MVIGSIVAMLCLLGTACQTSGAANPPASGGAASREPSTAPGGGSPGATVPAPSPSPTPVASAARVHIPPADGSRSARPDSGISVTVTHGRITGVTVHTDGDRIEGAMDARATSWHSRWALNTSTEYTVRATAVDDAGRSVTVTSEFRTLTPSSTLRTIIFEGYHKEYGVGMPIILQFDEPVADREAVERSLELRTSKPVVGAWYWNGDQTLMFRPRGYWPAHTQVHFTGHLDGVRAGPGLFGVHTLTQDFHIGRSLVAVASTRTHHMQVYLDKKLLGDWPISTGKPGHETPNGTYLTITKSNPEEMIGEDYDIFVPWSVRFTWSGSFLHAAPWSVNQQGSENVSHGCVNIAPANAERYYKLSVPGDPVTIVGSPLAGAWDDGWTVWFLNWKEILEGSALHQAVRTGPSGSRFVNPGELPAFTPRVPLQGPHPGNALAVPAR